MMNHLTAGAGDARRRDLLARADQYRTAHSVLPTRPGRRLGRGFVRVRPIRPSDRGLLEAGFAAMSADSRYARFLHPKQQLSPRELAYFTDVDHHDHEALIALERFRGNGMGVARFIRHEHDPRSAEIAFVVVDAWQGRGVGRILAKRLAQRAREEGITSFDAISLYGNMRARRVLEGLGDVTVTGRDGGTVSYRVHLANAVDPDRQVQVGAVRRWFARAQLGPVDNYAVR